MFLSAEKMLGGYGETTILNDCSISVKKGEIAVIVGPNGAGKSTAMKAIFGMLDLRAGNIIFDGKLSSLKRFKDDAKEVANCLRALGYQKKQQRVNGGRPYLWSKSPMTPKTTET